MSQDITWYRSAGKQSGVSYRKTSEGVARYQSNFTRHRKM